MGTYVNLGNEGFQGMLSYEYVDKTGLIALVNAAIGTPNKLICSTRPRRFGKTFAAEFLVAHYSQGTDSRDLFEGWPSAATLPAREAEPHVLQDMGVGEADGRPVAVGLAEGLGYRKRQRAS